LIYIGAQEFITTLMHMNPVGCNVAPLFPTGWHWWTMVCGRGLFGLSAITETAKQWMV